MSLATHISSLESKHHHLEVMLEDEVRRPMPDFTIIQTLKKQKLLIKEEMRRLQPEFKGTSGGAA